MVPTGVPQDSVLGPLVFAVFVNSMGEQWKLVPDMAIRQAALYYPPQASLLQPLQETDLPVSLRELLSFQNQADDSKTVSFCKVSKIWREIIYQDKNTFQKRKLYLKQLKASSEQCHLTQVEDAATRLNLLTRSALSSVQPQSKVTLTHAASTTPVSSSEKCGSARRSSSRHEQHLKIAQSLFNDEALKQCPRCQSPAKYQSMTKRAVCTRESCCFDFCTQCLCVFHGSKECSNGSAKRRNRNEALPGSAQSKRNLKRL
ncbi:F-box only protein 43-like [Protopterus annectens]|uniref:F-box only protein 43-like n=1 Tax=Protopterus annectens TaxID=7888 RepID=UPI001CFC0853|nr:F-box only protein 43-like [Protopterus annectens]